MRHYHVLFHVTAKVKSLFYFNFYRYKYLTQYALFTAVTNYCSHDNESSDPKRVTFLRQMSN